MTNIAFEDSLIELYRTTHQEHMQLIADYKRGDVHFDTYKVFDAEYTVKLHTLKQVVDAYIQSKEATRHAR